MDESRGKYGQTIYKLGDSNKKKNNEERKEEKKRTEKGVGGPKTIREKRGDCSRQGNGVGVFNRGEGGGLGKW